MSGKLYSLAEMSPGDTAIIRELGTTGRIRRRLMDIGFIPGTGVECVQKSPLGDPIAYAIRGAIIALRREESSTIIV